MVNLQNLPADIYRAPRAGERQRHKKLKKRLRVKTKSQLLKKLEDLGIKGSDVKGNSTVHINAFVDFVNSKLSKSIPKLINESKFQRVINRVVRGKATLTDSQANKMWNKIQGQGRHVLVITHKNGNIQYITLSERTKDYFFGLMTSGINAVFVSALNQFESDVVLEYRFADLRGVKIEKFIAPRRIIKNKDGRFFPFINTSSLDLSKYQIYNEKQAKETKNRENCLTYTLRQCGIDDAIINNVKLSYFNDGNYRKVDLKKIALIINNDIILYYKDTNGKFIKKKLIKSLNKVSKPLEIAIYENHYFKYEITQYTKYSINNYEDVKDEKEFYNITEKNKNKNRYVRRPNKFKINSLLLVIKFFEKNYFKKLDMSMFEESTEHKELKDHIYLDNIENEQREFKKKEIKKNESKIYFADCESFVKKNPHKLYLIGVVNNKSNVVDILNVCDKAYQNERISKEQLTVWKFLKIVSGNGKNDAIVYFHNLKYDYHLLEPYINIISKCEKDNQLYSIKLSYKSKTIELRDSFKLLSFALGKFGEVFKLKDKYRKKEAIAYTYYTEKNNDKRIKILDYNKLLSKDEQLIFLKNVLNEDSYNDNSKSFNPLEYYKEYLKLDCLVLKKGLNKFEKMIGKITENKKTKNKMSIYDSLTISSLTDKFMMEEGAYDGVYEITGNLREYVGRAVYGGRVCVNKKYKKKVIEGKISDYDGVSLYPSSINRLCRVSGLMKGKAERLLKKDFIKWESLTYSIMTVKINKINKKQQMPFIAHKTKESTKYLNEVPDAPVIIDKYTLQDYIRFHKIDFEILDGVFWNNGTNKKMGKIIKKLFNERLKHKKNNVALANTLKLMLNSSYGKTIMKKSKSENIIIKINNKKYNEDLKKWEDVGTEDNLKSYIYNNFNTIKSYRKMNENNYEINKLKIDTSYNRGHIGCAILSMSKRIMNEVFDIANDNDYPIYYTDTDSLHLNYEDVPKLEKKYKEIYNKELNGKNLEQFHTDFNLKGAKSEIYATKSIFLGKKSYIDYLESLDEKNNKITGYHYRLKGITVEGLAHSAKDYKNSYFGLYEDLAKGNKKTMILNPYNPEENKNKVLFEYKNGKVSTKREFTRVVHFE